MWRPILVVILFLALPGCGGDQGEKYLQAGFAYFQQQDYDRAIENYEKAIASGAKSPGAYNMLGLAYRFKYRQTGKPELQQNEIDAFQKALSIDPKYWVAMVNLGTTYYSRGEKAQAASWLKKALDLNPNHPEKAQIEVMIAEGVKAPEAPQPAGKSAPPALPEGRDADAAEKYLQQGLAYFQKQEYDQAIKNYKKAIELDPKNITAYNMFEMSCRFKYNQLANSAKKKVQPSKKAKR